MTVEHHTAVSRPPLPRGGPRSGVRAVPAYPERG
ncbi:MAG: hypothetical protein GAK28_03109 [Luteibacter sp.]|nr:MAG: hypothetical protein GAK28_03109 [Luteibacter sp.]